MSVEEHYNGDGTDGSTIKMIKKTRAKMTQPTIQEVLEDYQDNSLLVHKNNKEAHKEALNQALSSIRQILEEGVPKKEYSKVIQDERGENDCYDFAFDNGRNQAISEIQQWIKEVCE